MPNLIARLYDSPATAKAAATELETRGGFATESIQLVSAPSPTPVEDGLEGNAPPTPTGSFLAEVEKTGIPTVHAKVYAAGVERGQGLLVVDPPFGSARAAMAILDKFAPVEVDAPEVHTYPLSPATGAGAATGKSGPIWRNPAPLSTWLGWRVLSSDPTPLSNYFGWRVLKPQPAHSPTLEKIKQQSADAAPLSKKLGWQTLIDNPTPLSAKAGWKVLKDDPAPLSTKAGWKVLLDNPAPLSTKAGWKVASYNPAPLSTKLGWKLLINNPTPLSSWLGWKVLSKD
jgi:hypothetical protein